MNYIKLIIITFIAFSYSSCEKCEKAILEPCAEEAIPNSEYCGWTVATCYAEQGQDVAVVYDTRFNSTAPKGEDWGTAASPVTAIHPPNWNEGEIGQVFGIAIDDEQNIYLASSDIYMDADGITYSPPIISGNVSRPYSAGQVFRCSPPTWTAIPFVDIPNTGADATTRMDLNSLGNIAFDKWNRQFFITNLEDGKIYRVDMAGNIQETYDPWADDIAVSGIVKLEERVWGIGVNKEGDDVKVYFPRVSNNERSIYSITLNNEAFPTTDSEIIEIPNVPGSQNIISDIAFSSNGNEMLIAERGNPHRSSSYSYTRTNTWSLNPSYFVGRGTGENSAGGVDFSYTEKDQNRSFECDEFFWVSANYMDVRNGMVPLAYGLQGIDYEGNNSSSAPAPTANQDTDIFIDFDGASGVGPKGSIGDVEVFDCTACIDPCTLGDYLNN